MARKRVKSISKVNMDAPLGMPEDLPSPEEFAEESIGLLPPPPPDVPPCPCPLPPLPPLPPPPQPLPPKHCCPSSSQIVDNVTVMSLDEEKITVAIGLDHGMKAYGIDAKTFQGIGTTGMVPVPDPGDEEKYLRADGQWSILPWYQSDWEEEDPLSPSYIRNKPVIDTELDADSPNAIANSAVTRAIDDIIERLDNIVPVDDADIVDIVQDTMQPGDGEPSINFDNMNIGG